MTIGEYMNNLTLESMAVANEMANDAMLCDFYTAFSDDTESYASEGADLAFDDEDVAAGYDSNEPATEAGFFKSLGSKFKNMLETIKGWFEKVASTIKGWIEKFVGRIKDKVAAVKKRRTAMAIAGDKADMEYGEEKLAKRKTELLELKKQLEAQYKNETNASKSQQINAKIKNIEKQIDELEVKTAKFNETKAVPLAKIYAQRVSEGIQHAEKAFKIACSDQDAIGKIFLKIMNTKTGKSNTAALVQDKVLGPNGTVYGDYGANSAALKHVKGAEGMLKDLDKMLEGLTKVKSQLDSSATEINKAAADFAEAAPDEASRNSALDRVNVRVPSSEFVTRATQMKAQCDKYAKQTAGLAAAFGNEPDEDSNEKDKRPAIAKALSAFSKVASSLVSIATTFLNIAGKGESLAVNSDAKG